MEISSFSTFKKNSFRGNYPQKYGMLNQVLFLFSEVIHPLDLHKLSDMDMDVDVDFGTQEENSITSMTFLF